MNFSRDYGPLQVSHRPTHGDYFDSILHFHVRELPPIYETIETKIAELVKQHLTDPARQLPEVILYRELRDKDTGIADVLAKIDADRELLQIDHRRAILTLSGEELATTLASIKEKLQAVESRVQAVRDGQDAFRREVAKARDLAVAALDRLLVAALPTLNDLLEAEVKRTHSEAASQAPALAEPLLRVLDTAAIALEVQDRFRSLANARGASAMQTTFGAKLTAILAEPSRKAAEAPAADGEGSRPPAGEQETSPAAEQPAPRSTRRSRRREAQEAKRQQAQAAQVSPEPDR